MVTPCVAAALVWRAPVAPDRGTARVWAAEELAHREYREAQPGLLARILGWVLDWLDGLRTPTLPGSRLALLVAVLVVVVLAGAALLVTGPVRRSHRVRADRAVLVDDSWTAARLRRSADDAAAEGDWRRAVQQRFRAVVRALEERDVLEPRPGRTADEAAREAALLLPGLAPRLHDGAARFDEIVYGAHAALPRDDEQLRRLDAAVAAGSPRVPQGVG